jgi:hypothetical protein
MKEGEKASGRERAAPRGRGPDIKALVEPVAAYIAAADDPRSALAEILSEMIEESAGISVEARQHMGAVSGRRGRSA